MRGITKRIFFAVIIAAIISFGCFFVVLMDMEDITNKYNNLIDGYIGEIQGTRFLKRTCF